MSGYSFINMSTPRNKLLRDIEKSRYLKTCNGINQVNPSLKMSARSSQGSESSVTMEEG